MTSLRSLWPFVLLLTACGGGDLAGPDSGRATPRSIPFAPTPDADPFFVQPADLPDVPPGTVINSRASAFQPNGISQPNPAWQIQYTTRDVNGFAIAATATVVKSLVPAAGSPVLVSYLYAYDSLGAPCIPSHTLTGGSANASSQAETPFYLPGLQTLGWTIVFPDYEGPYHAYGAGKLSGQATLDAIRAALSFEPLGLSADTPVGLWGYSGGALAAAWAATLQGSYAPELNIVGIASGGTPADMLGIVKHNENGQFFSLIMSAVVGVARAYPELIPDSLLNDKGRQAIESAKDGCVGGTTDGSAPATGRVADYTTVEDPYSTPGALAVAPLVTLPQAGMTPIAEMYVYHEILDELIPIAGTDALIAAWCADGARISYLRSTSGEHIAGLVSGAPLAIAYLTGQFNGSPVPVVSPLAQTCN